MSNLKHYLDLIRNGDVFYNEKMKFSIILDVVSVIHVAYAVLFFIMGNFVLGAYNLLAVMEFQSCKLLIKKQRYLAVVVGSNLEIVIFCTVLAILYGRECGFQYLIIALIPVIFYLSVAWNCFKHKELGCMLFSIGFFAAFLFIMIYTAFMEPLFRLRHWQGLTFEYINISVMFVAIIMFLYMFVWDISHKNLVLAQQNSRLDEMANRDPLTKLYNRRFMDVQIQQKMANLSKSGKIFCMILGDIDNFKHVNDTYGHDSGDEVLKAIANCMVDDLRDTDFVCRWGGEEFMIVVDGNHKVGMDLAERIRKKIEVLDVDTKVGKINITMTFGVSESIPGYSVDKMLQIADKNLYEGKGNGKNQVVG